MRIALLLLVLIEMSALAPAQETGLVRIPAHVSGVFNPLVEIDVGSEQRVEPGDRVLIYPPGMARIEGVVVSVNDYSSRVAVGDTQATLTPGATAEVLFPDGRQAPTNEAAHPPWEHPTEDFDPSQPLLAPGYARKAAERDVDVRGRVYTMGDWTDDNEGSNSEHSLMRGGVDLEAENLFGRGGEVHFDGELWRRSFSGDDADDDDDTRVRIDRISYLIGGRRDTARRLQAGRFLQHEFPELGVLDGVEYTHRLGNGDRVGVSAGFMPELDAKFKTGDDAQAAVYYTHTAGENEELQVGGAFQKTWHEGKADRDLLIGKVRFRPKRGLYMWGTTRVDYYGSEDDAKSDGFQLTDLNLGMTLSSLEGDGLSVTASRFRFPDLRRDEFTPVTREELEDNELNRVGANGWKRITKNVRLTGRVDRWDDEDDSGTSGEIGASWRDGLWERGELSVAVFSGDGEYSDTKGVRFGANGNTSVGFWSLQWEIADFDQDGFDGSQSDLTQHRLRGSWDVNVGKDWSVSTYGESRFGDEQDSMTFGFYLQRSF